MSAMAFVGNQDPEVEGSTVTRNVSESWEIEEAGIYQWCELLLFWAACHGIHKENKNKTSVLSHTRFGLCNVTTGFAHRTTSQGRIIPNNGEYQRRAWVDWSSVGTREEMNDGPSRTCERARESSFKCLGGQRRTQVYFKDADEAQGGSEKTAKETEKEKFVVALLANSRTLSVSIRLALECQAPQRMA
ncbi:hypothetical protein L210DRAFT_3508913 [Boletus edulis BED1]|uniref:Uncharacterized protein n=1 Tax=Boletus edulis BED1 TaxID=1328754 RepID=A0AAD4BG68_BOLED|nr:hypothetical protein L210DRAFT_3508913 [Boletus edulis BED1]